MKNSTLIQHIKNNMDTVYEGMFNLFSKTKLEPTIDELLKVKYNFQKYDNIKIKINKKLTSISGSEIDLKITTSMLEQLNNALTYVFLNNLENEKSRLLKTVHSISKKKIINNISLTNIKYIYIYMNQIDYNDQYMVFVNIGLNEYDIEYTKDIYADASDIEDIEFKSIEKTPKENAGSQLDFKDKLKYLRKNTNRYSNHARFDLEVFDISQKREHGEIKPTKIKKLEIPKLTVSKMNFEILSLIISDNKSVDQIRDEFDFLTGDDIANLNNAKLFAPGRAYIIPDINQNIAFVWYAFSGKLYNTNGQSTVLFAYDIKTHNFKYLTDLGRYDHPDSYYRIGNGEDVFEYTNTLIKKYKIGNRI